MKVIQVFFVLSVAAVFVSAKPKCTLEPSDCRYDSNGNIIKDLNYLSPYIKGLSCKEKETKVVEIFGALFVCCEPKAKTTECQTKPPPTTTRPPTTVPETTSTTTTTTTPPPTTTTTTTTPPPTTTTTPPPTTTTTTTTPPPTTTTTTTTPPPTTTTTTTTPPPTTTTTTTTPPPTKCEKVCSSGILDNQDGFCRCCDFVEYPKYLELQSELDETIEQFQSAGNADPSIEARINAIQEKLDAINAYVIENCGTPSSVFISAQFEIIGRDIKTLRFSVQEFISSLQYNASCDSRPACTARLPTRKYTDCSCFCGVSCNATADFVTLRDRCACQYFEGWSDFIDLRTQTSKTITELSYSFFDTTTANTIIKELLDELSKINTNISGFENNWDRTTIESKQIFIETTITRVSGKIETARTFTTTGPCNPVCTRPRVNKITDCSCYVTKPISDFFRVFGQLLSLESQIRGYNYRTDTTNKNLFNDWVARLKAEGKDFYDKVTSSVFDVPTQTILFNNFNSHFTELSNAWKDYIAGRVVTTTKCNVVCSGDSVKNCATCSCTPIDGFNKLKTEVTNGIPGLLTQISGIDIDESDRTILTKNANTIKDGIANLLTYVETYCGNLDENYVQLVTYELLGWYTKLISDITAIQNPIVTEVCAYSCPNSRWVYDAVNCKCTCDIIDCVIPSEVLDPYNCLCAKKSSCALTTASCSGATPLLDYSNCKCKARPTP